MSGKWGKPLLSVRVPTLLYAPYRLQTDCFFYSSSISTSTVLLAQAHYDREQAYRTWQNCIN